MIIENAIQRLKEDSSMLPKPIPADFEGAIPMTFRSTLAGAGAAEGEISVVIPNCPIDLKRFWLICEHAKLWEDVIYGQWGLEILSPAVAAQVTSEYKSLYPKSYRCGDLIIGRFLGDSELLLTRVDPLGEDFEAIFIVNPIDPRDIWISAGETFGKFLDKYIKAKGDKFWEPRKRDDQT